MRRPDIFHPDPPRRKASAAQRRTGVQSNELRHWHSSSPPSRRTALSLKPLKRAVVAAVIITARGVELLHCE